jgi:hypothetical protein
MKIRLSVLLFVSLIGVVSAMAQGTNATISGTVTDPSGLRVSAAKITAENTRTGVALTNTTNEAGVYSFSGIQPGTYRLTAVASGFRTYILNDIVVEVSARLNINFSLVLATIAEAVEVTAQSNLLFTDSASVGGVITGQRLLELPLPDRNVLDLVLTQPGVVGDNFAGARIGALNVTRDGINVMDQTVNSGVNSVIFNSADVVEEVRVITSPVDAELGRGSGQVQMITRSGTKQFHGSIFEYNGNTALNANNWFNNLRGGERDTVISNRFGGRLGGPVGNDKTFFHFLYEGLRERIATAVTSLTYTDQARQGLFRFYPGVQNGNANSAVPTVDLLGNPVRPPAATGDLQTVNLFNRDPVRPGPDPSGTVQRLLAVMPSPNDFRVGDGLNNAGYTWRIRQNADYNQYNLRIDHGFNERHRLSFSLTKADSEIQNGFMPQSFPSSPGGKFEQPEGFYSISLNSTLSSATLNEFRAGAQRSRIRGYAPWELSGGRDLMPSANGYPYLPLFNLVTDPIPSLGDPQGRISPLYSFGDTFHWTIGKHALKFGGEMRFASYNGFRSDFVVPRVLFGLGQLEETTVNSVAIPGLGANEAFAQDLLTDLTGSVAAIGQSFNASFGSNPVFLAGEPRQRTWRQREFSLFIQDDMRLRPGLTFNLGLRYEFYSVPWDAHGRTAGLVGGSTGLFGISGDSWSDVYRPDHADGELTRVQLIGKGSPNPNVNLYANDVNNFAPVAGLTWSIPYFGKDQTILHAGYSVSYERSPFAIVDIVSGNLPGLTTRGELISEGHVDLTNVQLPLVPLAEPLEVVPLTDRSQVIWAFDNKLRTPYVQNWNLSIERRLPENFTLAVRYVGGKGTKLIRSVNINEVNIFENGILEAFQITQAGGNSPLMSRFFLGGSATLRSSATTRGMLANNNVGEFAQFLNTFSVFGERGGLLRFSGLPENWIVANPQFGGANLVANFSNSTYHSLQVAAQRRISKGWSLESNYTWSRTLGDEEGSSQNFLNNYRNGRDRHLDKRLLAFHRTHVFRNSGTWDLPFGPDRMFFTGTRGMLAQVIHGWQVGGILNIFSGSPIGLFSGISSFNQHLDNTPTLVAPLPNSAGTIKKTDNGVVYFDGFTQVPDPGISNLTPLQLLNTRSTLKALADSSGTVVAVNPAAGKLGTLSQTFLEGPGALRFDVNLIKEFRIGEGKEFQLRGDAINVLNSPQFINPITEINSTNFGRVVAAGGERVVRVSGRFSF